MVNRANDTAVRDIDTLFRLGVVSGMSDGELLDRFMMGGGRDPSAEAAFDAIVRRHGPMVLGVCLRVLGDFHAAEDALQATFLVLAVRAGAIRKRESLAPWLHGVARRIARRALHMGRRRKEESIDLLAVFALDGGESRMSESRAIIDEELSRLPDKYRLPVILCYLEGQTQEEVAERLGWTKGTVSGRLARAKDLLRSRLARRGLAPTAGALAASLTSQTANGALPVSLLAAIVRAASAARLGGPGTALVSGRVATLVRESLRTMSLTRIGWLTTHILLLGLGTATIATPIFRSSKSEPSTATAGLLGPRSSPLDRSEDPLPARARLRLGTTQRRHTAEVVCVAFAVDGAAVVSAQADGLVRLWDPASGRAQKTINLIASSDSSDLAIRDFHVSTDGRIMAALIDRTDPGATAHVRSIQVTTLPDGGPSRLIVEDAGAIDSLAISPDGSTLATGTATGEIQLWDVATGQSRAMLRLNLGLVPSLTFAPDGNTLAIAARGTTLTLWDLEERRTTPLGDVATGPFAPCFSADGHLVAVNGIDGETVIVERTSGRRQLAVRGVARAFAPDSRALAMTGAGALLKVIDTMTGGHRWETALGYGLGKSDVSFSPNGRTLVTARGGALRFFEVDSGRERLAEPDAHQGSIRMVGYTPGGDVILTAADDGTVRRWDAADGRPLGVIGHAGRVHVMAVAPDGRSLATAALLPDATVRVWDLFSGLQLHQWPGHGDLTGAEALAFSADGQLLLSYGRDKVLRARELATGRERPAEQPRFLLSGGQGADSAVLGGAFAPGNRFIAVNTGLTTHVAELSTGEERFFTPSATMAFAADGQSLAVPTCVPPSGSRDADETSVEAEQKFDGIDIVNLGTGESRRFDIPREPVTALAFSADGSFVAVAGGARNHTIRLYRAEDGRRVEEFVCPAERTHPGALAFSPDGQSLAAGLDDTTVLVWNLRNAR